MAHWTSFVVLLLLVNGIQSGTNDDTLRPEAKGATVVKQTEKLVKESHIFPNDKKFTRRVAFVESADGLDPDTFRDGYHGGIWQVDKDMFDVVKSEAKSLRVYLGKIKQVFGIDFSTCTWEELRRPLYSSLGAKLFIILQMKNGAGKIPENEKEQAEFWQNHYRNRGDPMFYEQEVARLIQMRLEEDDPCGDDAECKCECDVGWHGDKCEFGPCDPDPCEDGHVCIPGDDGTYECECEGDHCEVGPGYDCEDNNPCTDENIANGHFYHPHHNPNKFVQCDEHGGCFVMDCPPGLVWDPEAYTCNRPGGLAEEAPKEKPKIKPKNPEKNPKKEVPGRTYKESILRNILLQHNKAKNSVH
jgi:hypothetical protein